MVAMWCEEQSNSWYSWWMGKNWEEFGKKTFASVCWFFRLFAYGSGKEAPILPMLPSTGDPWTIGPMGPLRPGTCCWRKGRSWRKAPITSMPLLGNQGSQGSARRNMEKYGKYDLESLETWGKEAQHILNCWIIFTASLADLRQRRLVGIPLGLHLSTTNWEYEACNRQICPRKTQINSHIAQKRWFAVYCMFLLPVNYSKDTESTHKISECRSFSEGEATGVPDHCVNLLEVHHPNPQRQPKARRVPWNRPQSTWHRPSPPWWKSRTGSALAARYWEMGPRWTPAASSFGNGCGFPETTLPLVGAELTWAHGCCFQDHPRSQFQILQTNQVFGSLKSKLIRLLPGSVRKTGQLHNHQVAAEVRTWHTKCCQSSGWWSATTFARWFLFVPVSNIKNGLLWLQSSYATAAKFPIQFLVRTYFILPKIDQFQIGWTESHQLWLNRQSSI